MLDTQSPRIEVPEDLLQQIWSHAQKSAPQACVGMLGGLDRDWTADEWGWEAVSYVALPPLTGAASPYQVDTAWATRATRGFSIRNQTLVGIVHSHPMGPSEATQEDIAQAGHPVPYLIADLSMKSLRAFLLPTRQEVAIRTILPSEVPLD